MSAEVVRAAWIVAVMAMASATRARALRDVSVPLLVGGMACILVALAMASSTGSWSFPLVVALAVLAFGLVTFHHPPGRQQG